MRRAVTLLKYGNSFIPVDKWFFSESSKFYFYSALSPPHNPYPISLLGINSRIKTGITRGLQDLPYQLLKLIYLLLFANFFLYLFCYHSFIQLRSSWAHHTSPFTVESQNRKPDCYLQFVVLINTTYFPVVQISPLQK